MTHPATQPRGIAGGGAFGFHLDGYDRAEMRDLTASELARATVYGRDDEAVGSIRSLEFGANGTISGAVIDVGAFLGMGAHSVAFPFSRLTVLRATDGSGLRVHLDMTEATLRPMSFYDK